MVHDMHSFLSEYFSTPILAPLTIGFCVTQVE
jgi:hypothetical protein